VAARNSLLDRGYGKPVAPIELDNHRGEFDHLSDDELYAWLREEAKNILESEPPVKLIVGKKQKSVTK
jgi:hypothetical protein